MDLENTGHGGRPMDVPHVLTDQGRPVDLTGVGMTRTSGEKDDNAGTFYELTCPGRRGHFGGGKHTRTTVPPMQHAGPLV